MRISRHSQGTAVSTPASRERLVRLRLVVVGLSIGFWGLVVMGRLFELQVLEHDSWRKRAAEQSESTIDLAPRRGTILDRQGRPLAVSVEAVSVFAVPKQIDDPVATAARIAPLLGMERREVLAALQRGRNFSYVKRKVDPATARAVKDLGLPGLGFQTESRRYYPKRELASQVLGHVGLDNDGLSGVEHAFDGEIRGRAARVVIRNDAKRRPIGHLEKPATDGNSVVLSIDEAVQHVAERELERSMQETQAIAGTVLVMDPATGEVLAVANRPTFNPNRKLSSKDPWRDRALSDSFEPGSVFKVFTAAAGLQEKVVSPDEVIDCGHGAVEVAGVRINDHAVFDQLTFRDVIAKSSDVGVIRVAQRLGRENFNRYVRAFGFGAPTGIDLAEEKGLLKPPSRWSAISLASMSFGQEVSVTPLQLANAMCAVANGGHLMRPLMVLRVEDAAGRTVKTFEPQIVRQVLEPDTVATLIDVLQTVVKAGTGRRAAIPGYRVAGKTGTAQKFDFAARRYSMVDHVASFIGMVPASRPALVVLASLDEPRGAANQGGDVAAPLFQRVASQALRLLHVPPDDDPGGVLRVQEPDVPGLLRAAYQPAEPAAPPAETPEGQMPDLRGRSAREAVARAARRGILVELSGTGLVRSQSPEPGAAIEPGTVCRLTLSPAGESAPTPEPEPTPALPTRAASAPRRPAPEPRPAAPLPTPVASPTPLPEPTLVEPVEERGAEAQGQP